jgi:hypothetical protein
MWPYVAALAEEHDGDVLESTGRSEFLGRPTNGSSTDPLADSREHYRRIIADYEEKRGVPNQAGTAANGGGGGASVSGDPAAGRSPTGGSIVRGVTYKGGAFTPAGEQKAPPAPKEGSPERFKKRKAKLNRAANLAAQGASETADSKIAKIPSLRSDAAENVARAYNNSETSQATHGHLGQPMFNYAGRQTGSVGVSAPVGDAEIANKHTDYEEPTTSALYATASKLNGMSSDTPVAHNSDINAIRHLLYATVRQRVTPYQRYAGAKALATDRSARERLDKMCDEMQRIAGAASHGQSHWLKALGQETRPINHDVPLSEGVTRLDGTILPYSDNPSLIGHVAQRSDETMGPADMREWASKDRPWLRRYAPQNPIQYGLLDYLHSTPSGQPVYGTPDGNIFLDPVHANGHVQENPGILKYHGRVFMPWQHIHDRVQNYTGVDDLIKKIGNDDVLHKMEQRPQLLHESITGTFDPSIISQLRGILGDEPKRFKRLIDLLEGHLNVNPKEAVYQTALGSPVTNMSVNRAMTPSDLDALARARHPAGYLSPNLPLGAAFSTDPTSVTKMASRLHGLFHHFRQEDQPMLAHLGTYLPQTEDDVRTHGFHYQGGYNPETNSPILGPEHGTMFEPDSALPFSLINMSQLATPVTLAHEMGHHIGASIPGIDRVAMEHAFANSNGGFEKIERPDKPPEFRWKKLDTTWASTKDRQSYAKLVYPGMVTYAAPWNDGPRRLNHFNGANEYLSTMMEEFFARPVRMARQHPQTLRFLLGIMNGALRNHR